jgi:hypothetical protein
VYYGFGDRSQTSLRGWKGERLGETAASQLHAGLIRKVLEEIGDPFEWRLTMWGRAC